MVLHLVFRRYDLVLVAVLRPFQLNLYRLVVDVDNAHGLLVLVMLLLLVVVLHARLPATNHGGHEVEARVRLRMNLLLRGLEPDSTTAARYCSLRGAAL